MANENQTQAQAPADNLDMFKSQIGFLNTVASRMAVYEIAQSLAQALSANLSSVDVSNIVHRVNQTKRGK